MKKIQHKANTGFSLIEILVATVLVVILSATSYRVLSDNGKVQGKTLLNQKQNDQLQRALAMFNDDVSKIDPGWLKLGVASVYPHPGLGLGENYYVNSYIRDEGLNDAVSFIHRNQEKPEIYSLKKKIANSGKSSSSTSSNSIFPDWIQLNEPDAQIEIGDMVLISQPGKYYIGVVTETTSSPIFKIKLRNLNSSEAQATHQNMWNRSSGFVTKSGLVPGSFDWNKNNTADVSDDGISFEVKVTKIQVVSAKTYELDWATTDGQPHGTGNAYVLDDQGNRKKVLVRTSYTANGKQREVLAEATQLELTYDMLVSAYGGTSSFSGYTDGSIERDVGRSTSTAVQFANFNTAPESSDAMFISSARILSVQMSLGEKSGQGGLLSSHIALDPVLQDERYQSSAGVESALTNDLKTKSKNTQNVINEQSGKPLYLVNANGSEVLLPVSTFEMTPQNTMGPATNGAIYVYNTEGCAVNSSSNCDPNNSSKIQFNLGANTKFFPNTISQAVLSDGTRRIYVGGISMSDLDTANPTRSPILGVITLGPTETLQEKLSSQDDEAAGCNISGCQWYSVDTTTHPDFLDTANISVDKSNPDVLYVATLTKTLGEDSKSKIYKAVWNGSQFTYSELAEVNGTETGRVVTAVSDQVIKTKAGDYLAVCTSKKMSSSCNGECITSSALTSKNPDSETAPVNNNNDEDTFGQIQLISTNPSVEPKLLTEHNYRCSSLAVDQQNNLLVPGRLSVQEVPFLKIYGAIQGNPMSGFMFLDEVAYQNNDEYVYADYFLVEPNTYQNSSDQQKIGWLTGLSAVQFPDGTFGMVNSNKYKMMVSDGITLAPSVEKELANAGISKIKLAGMDDRVLASIKSDMGNLNASTVTATYSASTTTKPSLYIPGSFYKTANSNRTNPTPLPQLSPSMSDQSWFAMYQSLITPNQGGLDSGMPVFDGDMQKVDDCSSSLPKSCI